MPGSSPVTSATTFRASRSSCRATCRARAAAPRRTGSTTSRPSDGTVLATADQSLSLQQAAGDKRINFDTDEIHLHRQSQCREQHHGGLARVRDQDHRRRQAPRGDRRRDRRLDVVAISQGDERADRHQIQDRAGLSGRQRRQPRAGARRGGCARLEQLDLVEGDPAGLDRREEDQHPGSDRARQGARPAGRAALDGPRHE